MSLGVCPLSAPDAGTARSVPETENWVKVRITEYIADEIMSGTDSGFAGGGCSWVRVTNIQPPKAGAPRRGPGHIVPGKKLKT